ncbi:hypothetical protein vBVhaSMAG7_001 [Vibrio phage vB_VhaS_MAG7]|nr:hypothetical protein vBVhaSMAG7_001 [Vibrio phage vB_VhaS_MAG7]
MATINPFIKGTHKDFVLAQVEYLYEGNSEMLDLGDKDISAARQVLHKERERSGRLFSVKKDANGNYWVKRIK